MNPSINHLGKVRIRQLLAAVGAGSPRPNGASGAPSALEQDPTIGNVTEYNWRDPHYLNLDQLNRLAASMSQVAVRLGAVLTRFFGREFDVSPTAVTQHFADDLRRSFDLDHNYCLTFGPEKGPPCGFFTIPSPAVLAWATRLLGDSDPSGDPDRSLSSLEESLLSDLVAAVLETFLASLQPHETLRGGARLSKGQPGIQFELTEEICRIVFRVKESGKDDACDVAFLLSCGRLAALVGKTPAPAPRATPQELSRALMEHLQEMPVTVTVRLASAMIGFQEVLDLAPGDVLLLDKPIHETIELAIENRTAFRGVAAQSQGQYAILIKEHEAHQAQEAPTTKTPGDPRKG